MTLSAECRAIQREAQVAAEQIANGVTALGRANHAQTGLYSQAFFGISNGLERMGKLIFAAEHAIQNSGAFPTNGALKKFSHNLQQLLLKCEMIGITFHPERAYASRPNNPVHQGIVETLSMFATQSRYYNLDYIAGAAGQQTDPISMWWDKVAKSICEVHYSQLRLRRDTTKTAIMAELLKKNTMVLHHGEDGAEITDVGGFISRAGVTAVAQRYGRLYTLQIVRWLASLFSELSHRGAYEKRIEPLLGLDEPFVIFRCDDRYFLNRKTWSIYRP